MKTSPAQQTIVDRCNCMASPAAIQQAEKVPVGGEPSFQGIDTSSGALGAAVLRTVNEPIPILTVAPADHATRGKWCKTTASNISLAARPSSLYVLLRSHLD